MIQPIITIGNTVLANRSQEVPSGEIESIQDLIRDLVETLHATELVGIAAPQIGIDKRVFLTEVAEKQPDGEKTKTLRVFINPSITRYSDSKYKDYEGCGSVPNVFGIVERSKKITAEFLDMSGARQVLTAEGLLARVIQHEYDHLEGILFLSHVEDKESLLTKDELIEKYKKEKEERERKKQKNLENS